MAPWRHFPKINRRQSEDAADLSALFFTVVGMTVIGLALTVGVTLVVAWMLRGVLGPFLGVA